MLPDTWFHVPLRGQVKQKRQLLQSDTVNTGLLKWRCYSNIQRGVAFEHMECIYIYYVLKYHISLAVEGYFCFKSLFIGREDRAENCQKLFYVQ